MLAVITDYLQSRRQGVRIKDQIVYCVHAVSDVPQVSLLGPLLFSIISNDIPDSIFRSTAYLFADDIKLYNPTSESNRLDLRLDIDGIKEWISTHQMQFNLSKCQFLPLFFAS